MLSDTSIIVLIALYLLVIGGAMWAMINKRKMVKKPKLRIVRDKDGK